MDNSKIMEALEGGVAFNGTPDDLIKFLKQAVAENMKERRPREVMPLGDLVELSQRYLEENDFAAGDVVTWKKGLCNRNIPAENQPAVLLELKPGNLLTGVGPESTAYGEPLTARIAVGIDGGLAIFHVDANRLEKYTGDQAADPAGETAADAAPEPSPLD